jgi:hypothetical protein
MKCLTLRQAFVHNKFLMTYDNGFSPALKPFLFYTGFKVGFSGKDS